MIHWMLMKSVRVPGALLACVVLTTSGALHAQPRPEAPDPPDIRWLVLPEDRLSDEEMRGANPCRRNRELLKDRDAWQRMAWLSFCVQRVRSRTVTQAWEKGLDEYGVKLEADAPARKLAESEIWLRRLQGKYGVEGNYWTPAGSSPVRGTADCFGVGSGPGVSCLISTEWKAPKEAFKDPYLDGALYQATRGVVLLFGIDPGTQRVRVTLMDFRAIGMSGLLDKDTVMFEGRPNFENIMPFLNPLVVYTWTNSLVTTKPGGDLEMKFLVQGLNTSRPLVFPGPILFDLKLRRAMPASAK